MNMNRECFGCRLANRLEETNVIYENDDVICILDIEPLNDGHTLILPKTHYFEIEEIDEQTLHSIMMASIKISKGLKELYNPDGISIIQNGGYFNDLRHYHMHVFPRYKEDGFGWVEPKHEGNQALNHVRDRLIEKIEK
jgi:diadenosine tetraphosphate (Ap4A) HIT family hydrolase